MHAGGYDGLFIMFVVVIVGIIAGTAYAFFIGVVKRYSFHGWKGGLLFLSSMIFSILLALAISNLFWDVFHLYNIWINIFLSSAASYPLAFFLTKRVYLMEGKGLLAKALATCGILFIGLLIIWFLAEADLF